MIGDLKLPGDLQPTGTFQLAKPDMSDTKTADERKRDFTRICTAQKDLYFVSIDSSGRASVPKLLELDQQEKIVTKMYSSCKWQSGNMY